MCRLVGRVCVLNTVHFVVSYLNKVFSDRFDWFVV